jgi:ferredoxin
MTQRTPVIDTDACIACGNCEAVCPLNENLGHSEVVNPFGVPEDRIQDAIDQCPAQCISWQASEA